MSKSLAVPATRGLILGREARDPDTGEAIDFTAEALRVVLYCATGAEKAVVLTTTSYGETTQAIHYVPDHPTRLAAATKILALVDRDQTSPAAIAVEERETITRTRERRRVAQVDG